MGKVILVFACVFVAAVVYELVNRTNPALTKKVEDLAHKKIDDVCGASHGAVAYEARANGLIN